MTNSTAQRAQEAKDVASAPAEPLYVRTIASVLQRHLEEISTSIHWVQPAGKETTYGAPVLTWPEDPYLSYAFSRGLNEGVILTVGSQVPHCDDLKPLLTLKFLGSLRGVLNEGMHVVSYLEGLDTAALLTQQQEWDAQ